MPAFEIIADGGDTANVKEVTVASITASAGDLLELEVGATAWTVAAATTENWQRLGILMGDLTTADTTAEVKELSDGMTIRATSTNNSSTSDNGDRMVLSSKSAVNNTGTDSTAEEAVFIQENASGVTGDKKITGRFILGGQGVNPDAA